MSDGLSFRADLYRGTAPYYDRYRPAYPDVLFDDLCRRVPVSGTGQLLDLACGTGQIAFPLAAHFASIWAIDQEPEAIAYGRGKAQEAGVSNIRWISDSAESVVLDTEFELIAVGNAFHRLHREVVAARMLSWLRPGGAVALLWNAGPMRGEQPWQQAMSELCEDWKVRLEATERVPMGWEEVMDRHPHHRVLEEAGFAYEGRFEFMSNQSWTTESLVGFVYSRSDLNRTVLGDQVAEFEHELEDLLHSFNPEGNFHESSTFAYELARKQTIS